MTTIKNLLISDVDKEDNTVRISAVRGDLRGLDWYDLKNLVQDLQEKLKIIEDNEG